MTGDADVVRCLTLVVVLQALAVISQGGRSEPEDSDSHDHHPPNNVWTTTTNHHDFVRYLQSSIRVYIIQTDPVVGLKYRRYTLQYAYDLFFVSKTNFCGLVHVLRFITYRVICVLKL